jgi:two-component system, NarL family, sensor histidine kinase UhpB
MTSSSLARKQIVLIDAPPGRREKIVSTYLVISSVAAFAFIAPAARVPLRQITAFVPAYEAALSVNDLLTSVLLFGQFARSGLKIAAGSGVRLPLRCFIIIPHALSFPARPTACELEGATRSRAAATPWANLSASSRTISKTCGSQ